MAGILPDPIIRYYRLLRSKRKDIRRRNRAFALRQAAIAMADRALPNFIITGVMKGGTSSLYWQLCEHENIKPASTKEVCFFSNEYYHWGLNWYRAHFPQIDEMDGNITGEASPNYSYHPLAIPRIAKKLPNTKIIMLLRNPVDRAISHYQHTSRKGREPLSMRAAFIAEHRRIAGEKERLWNTGDAYSYKLLNYSYKDRGLYLDQIKRLHQFFPKEQTLIVQSEKFFADPKTVLKECFSFLGIDPSFQVKNITPLNSGNYEKENVSAEIRTSLEDFFMPHNQALYEYLGEDFGW